MFHYFKFTLFHSLSLPLIIGLVLGGNGLYLGFFCTALLFVFGDLAFGDDESVPNYQHHYIFTAQLYAALPLTFILHFLLLWVFADSDILQFGSFIEAITGYDALAARQHNTLLGKVFAVLGCGLLTGFIATIVAHELTHRTADPIALCVGRWLLAFSWDAGFSIEHVYGHHTYVATEEDPATAPRGRNVYQHIVISTISGNISAAKIEAQRLAKKKQAIWSPSNRYLRGILMSLVLEIVVFFIAGWAGVLAFTLSALVTKSMLEIVNYMEHYGIVRDKNTSVLPRHSWNTNRRMSSWGTFNLTRHSHHHAEGNVPFYDLKPLTDSPMMISGYLSTIFLTLIPPLWNHLMIPKLIEWDRYYASQEERILAMEANKQSGIEKLQNLNRSSLHIPAL